MNRRRALVASAAAVTALLGTGLADVSARGATEPPPAASSNDAREARNRALVRHVIRRLDAEDLTVIERTHRADFQYHRPGVPAGLAPITGFWAAMFATYPDLSLTIEDLAADGNQVIARITFRGTPAGDTTPVTMYTADVWRVQGGRLAEHWDVVEDPEGMLRRLPAP